MPIYTHTVIVINSCSFYVPVGTTFHSHDEKNDRSDREDGMVQIPTTFMRATTGSTWVGGPEYASCMREGAREHLHYHMEESWGCLLEEEKAERVCWWWR